MKNLIAALTAGATDSKRTRADSGVQDAYAALKSGLLERVGRKVSITKALAALEERPRDKAAQKGIRDAISRVLMGQPVGEKLDLLANDLLKLQPAPRKSQDESDESEVAESVEETEKPEEKETSPSPSAAQAAPKPQKRELRPKPITAAASEFTRVPTYRAGKRPTPEAIMGAKIKLAVFSFVGLVALTAIVALVIRDMQRARQAAEETEKPVAAIAPASKPAPAASPTVASAETITAPGPTKLDPPSPSPKTEVQTTPEKAPEQPSVQPPAVPAAPKMKAEDMGVARRAFHSLRDLHALLDRGRKKPAFKPDEDQIESHVAKSLSVSVEDMRRIQAEFLKAVELDPSSSDEDKAIIAFEQYNFEDAAKLGLLAADRFADKGDKNASRSEAVLLYRLVGLAEKESGHQAASVSAFEKSASLTDESNEPLVYADSRLLLAQAVQRKGSHSRAAEILLLVLPIYEKDLNASDRKLSAALSSQAAAFLHSGKVTLVDPLLQRALELDEKNLGPSHPDVAVDLSNLASFQLATKRPKDAETNYSRALKIDELALGLDHPAVAADLGNLAKAFRAMGKDEEAEPLLRRALSIDEKASGLEHPDVALRLNQLAYLLATTKRAAEAEPMYRRALKINEFAYGMEHSVIGATVAQLGELLLDTGRGEEAETMFRRALQVGVKTMDPNDPALAARFSNLAEVLRSRSIPEEAEPLYAKALRIDEENNGPVHPSVAADLVGMALCCEKTNRLREAVPLYRRALKIAFIMKDESGRDHPEAGRWENAYSTALLALGWSAPNVKSELEALHQDVRKR